MQRSEAVEAHLREARGADAPPAVTLLVAGDDDRRLSDAARGRRKGTAAFAKGK